MAPVRPREPSIERTPEYDEFIEKLVAYHEKRGTHFDREPKVGNRHIDLLKLYKRVVDEGGYDKVSDTKTHKLAWRRLAGEFLPGSNNLTTQAFIVKSAYYKNLAAYEITHVHKREPPPKEILEDVSAKGGDLLSRTVENYFRLVSREADRLGNGEGSGDSDSENEASKTPKENKMDTDEPGSTGRVTRTLRHAPPQRVLFQPDVSAPRQTRQSTGAMNSPQPGSSSSALGTSDAAMTIANYQPRTAVPSSMKPVVTPATNPDYFRNLRNRYILSKHSRSQPYKGMMLPGTGYPGPNIYIRALHSLQSGVPEEEAYALHHMVKISHERGDKYRFDQFPGLAEALMNKVIQVASLFYDVSWDVSYVDEVIEQGGNVLNGLTGTQDLVRRIQSLQQLDIQDELLPHDVSQTLGLVNEAGLILRNMVMLHENAAYLSTIPIIRDVIVIILNLPRRAVVVELQHYALEIAEQLTRFWTFDSQDPVYRSLLAQTDTEDRGRIIASLKALGRTAMHIEAPVKLEDVPVRILHSICDWLLVEDEELRSACLDFLYLYTRSLDNVKVLVQEVNIEALVNEIARLLLHNSVTIDDRRNHAKTSKPPQFSDTPPKLSSFIIDQLVTLDEPERSSQWLRTCFEEDSSGEITQIALWSAYNAAFQDVMTTGQQQYKSLMPAKDFITNVSATFPGAAAHVVQGPTTSRYTIKGIRPRAVPVDPSTKKPYMRCQWQHSPSLLNGHADLKHSTARRDCGEFAPGPKAMWEHVVSVHLKVPRDDSGKWVLEQKPDINMSNGDAVSSTAPKKYFCQWGGCKHFHPSGSESAYEVGQHVKTHLPDTSPLHSLHAKHNRTPSNIIYTPSSAATVRSPSNPKPKFNGPVGFGALGMGNSHSDLDAPNGFDAGTNPQTPGSHPPPPHLKYHNTAVDERNDAFGLPLGAVLVLRNLARQMPKLDPPKPKPSSSSSSSAPASPTTKRRHEDAAGDAEGRHSTHASKKPRTSSTGDEELEREIESEQEGWLFKAFAPVKEHLAYVMAHNLTVKEYLAPVLTAVAGVGMGNDVKG
jgi:chromatin structure-remodeling complex subunit RSC9